MAYEIVELTRELSVEGIYTVHYYDYRNDFYFPGETHDFWEFQCVDKGEAVVTTDNGSHHLSRRQVIFHKPNEFHDMKANEKNAPNIIVVSFICHSECMRFFENKIIEFSDSERNILGLLIAEARRCFSSPLSLQKLPRQTIRLPAER